MISESILSKAKGCRVVDISRSGFYKRPRPPPSLDGVLISEIQQICLKFPRYGYRRVTKQLHRQGTFVNHKKVLALMKRHNILVKTKRRGPKTTDSNHSLRRYPNLVKDKEVTGINQVWVSDITYVVCGRKFLYLALIMDLFSRKIVGWELSWNIDAELTLAALEKAAKGRVGDLRGCIHHSDHGSQYLSIAYMARLKELGMLPSMGEVGNSYDNAFAESLNKTIKNEEVWLNEYETFNQAYESIARYIEEYNGERLHSSIGYMPPEEFEQQQLYIT